MITQRATVVIVAEFVKFDDGLLHYKLTKDGVQIAASFEPRDEETAARVIGAAILRTALG